MFKTFEFEFEARRLLWYAPTGGSDFAEVANVCERIKDGNYESWHVEWLRIAEYLAERAGSYNEKLSKGETLLRSSRYFQAAEFFLPPQDSRKLVAYEKSVKYFYKALDLLNVDYEINKVDYENIKLKTVFFKTKKQARGTIYVCGGFDALLEESYFTNVKQSLNYGYNVIIFEGPGQSDCLRKYKKHFTPKWNEVCKVVIDFYNGKTHDFKIGVGLSLGGLLIARAQSLDNTLFDRVVLYNYFPNMLDSFKINIPSFLHRYVDGNFPKFLEKIVEVYITKNKFLNWQVEHAKWTFGEKDLNNLLSRCREFSELVLDSPTLLFLAKNDNYYDYKQGLRYFEKITNENKKLVLFEKEKYESDLHCQNGAAYSSTVEIFEWLAE